MKDALDRKVTTIEKLEKSGMRKDLIAELKNNPNIEPLRLGDVNNYKGKNGIAYFGGGPSNEAQEAAFDRELRRKKKKRKGRSL